MVKAALHGAAFFLFGWRLLPSSSGALGFLAQPLDDIRCEVVTHRSHLMAEKGS